MSKILTPARVVAATTILTGLAAFVTGIVGVLPHGWQNMALAGAGLLTKAVTAAKFLHGNSAWELSPAGQIQAGQAEVQPSQPAAPAVSDVSIPEAPLPPAGLSAPIPDDAPAPVAGV